MWWQAGEARYVGDSVLPVGNWKHIAITYDSTTATFTGYVDGMPDGSSTYAGADLPASATIGNNDPLNEPMNGLIDELAVYGRALEPSEILGIFAAGSSGKCLLFKGHFETGDLSRW